MKDIINRIYELTNSTILTPYNLLDNILLENYKEIKFTKDQNIIKCEILAIEDNNKDIFFYEFDYNNKLQLAYTINENETIELFNRQKELNTLLTDYKFIQNKKIS